jgi:hypothetical protein
VIAGITLTNDHLESICQKDGAFRGGRVRGGRVRGGRLSRWPGFAPLSA